MKHRPPPAVARRTPLPRQLWYRALVVALGAGLPWTSLAQSQGIHVTSMSRMWFALASPGLVQGWLRDDQGRPLPERQLTVSLAAGSRRVETDARGQFRVPLTSEDGHRITVTFAGDDDHQPSMLRRDLDVTNQPLLLEVAGPRWIPVGPRLVEFQVRTLRQERPMEAEVSLFGPDGEVLARQHTDTAGWAALRLPGGQLGPPGRQTLSFRTGGGPQRQAWTQWEIVAQEQTNLTLRLHPAPVAGRSTLRGELTTSTGALPDQPIDIEWGSLFLGRATTNAQGHFAFPLPSLPELSQGAVLRAGYRPTAIHRQESNALVQVPPPAPIEGWLCLPLGLTVFVGLLIWGWQRTRQRPAALPPALMPEVGLVRRAPPAWPPSPQEVRLVTGIIWNPFSDRPVVGATITFDDGARLATQATDEEGRFRLSRLQQGDQEFAITAPGYLPLTLKVTLPHQGQLLDSQINLLPLKAEVLRLYQVLSAQFAPNLEVLPRWTPRELVAQARVNARAEAQDLRDFINLFEEVYYGPHAPSAEQLQRAESLVARLVPGTEDVDSTNSGHKRG